MFKRFGYYFVDDFNSRRCQLCSLHLNVKEEKQNNQSVVWFNEGEKWREREQKGKYLGSHKQELFVDSHFKYFYIWSPFDFAIHRKSQFTYYSQHWLAAMASMHGVDAKLCSARRIMRKPNTNKLQWNFRKAKKNFTKRTNCTIKC